MGKVRPDPYRRKNEDLVALIDGFSSAMGLNRQGFAVKVGIAPATLNRRMKAPEDFTLAELRRIFAYIGDRGKGVSVI